MLIRGDRLNPEQRKQVLAAFAYRWTTGNANRVRAYGTCPHCKEPGGLPGSALAECRQVHPTVPLATDSEWLAEHAFRFRRDGSYLSGRHAEPAYLATA